MATSRLSIIFFALSGTLTILSGFEKARSQNISHHVELEANDNAQESFRSLGPAAEPVITTSIESCDAESSLSSYRNTEHETEPQITVASLTIEGGSQLTQKEQNQIEASIREHPYFGNVERVTDDIFELLGEAWMNRGYLKAQVGGGSRVLSSLPMSSRIAVAARVDEGVQYRLDNISFRNNKAITNIEALRGLFPIKDGEIATREKIAEGLENLRKAYQEQGYINATFVPDSRFDDTEQLVSFDIEVDEGKQFVITSINLVAENESAAETASKYLFVKPGEIYNRRLVSLFTKKYSIESPLIHLNDMEGTVDLTLDIRHCPLSVQ